MSTNSIAVGITFCGLTMAAMRSCRASGTGTMPVFGSMVEAVAATQADVSVVFVPPKFAKAAVLEAIEAEQQRVARVIEPVVDPHAPLCFTCGIKMQRAGSCHACPSCGREGWSCCG